METKNGLRWNTSSILSISKKYSRTKKSKKNLKLEIYKLKSEVAKLYINDLSPIEFQDNLTKLVQGLEIKIIMENKNLEINLDSLKISKDENEKTKLNKDIEYIKNSIKTMVVKRVKLNSQILQNNIIEKYNKLQKDIDISVNKQ